MDTKSTVKLAFFLSYIMTISDHAVAINFDFIKRGFKSCTNTCGKKEVCEIENDATYRWCEQYCSHKFDMKSQCNDVFPSAARPILPYEDYKGTYNTNHISVMALKNLDRQFIEQTTDRRRVVGTAKTILLVREQLLTGQRTQVRESARIRLAHRLFKEYFKASPKIIAQYKRDGIISDDDLLLLFEKVKQEIANHYRNTDSKKQ